MQKIEKEAIKLAKNSACLKLLVDHDYQEEARIVADHLARYLLDSRMLADRESICDKMIESTKQCSKI